MTAIKRDETDKIIKKEPKPRKTISGPLRDKARTKARLVAAVGKVIQRTGYAGLSASSIAVAAGLDKKLIWSYFGGIDNLVEEYVRKKDFWKQAASGIINDLLRDPDKIGKKEIITLLQNQFEVVLKDKALQKIIHWEIGEKNKVLRELADKREEVGEELFKAILPDFEKGNIYNLRGRLALIVGGIYYLSLHAKSNGSTFCGIDFSTEQGIEEVQSAIHDLISVTYDEADVRK